MGDDDGLGEDMMDHNFVISTIEKTNFDSFTSQQQQEEASKQEDYREKSRVRP